MKSVPRQFWFAAVILLVVLVLGQGLSFVLAPDAWRAYAGRLSVILSMIAFWGPIIALVAALLTWATLRLFGFRDLNEIRQESVEQNNPAPAIIFAGTLIASILFLMLVIKP